MRLGWLDNRAGHTLRGCRRMTLTAGACIDTGRGCVPSWEVYWLWSCLVLICVVGGMYWRARASRMIARYAERSAVDRTSPDEAGDHRSREDRHLRRARVLNGTLVLSFVAAVAVAFVWQSVVLGGVVFATLAPLAVAVAVVAEDWSLIWRPKTDARRSDDDQPRDESPP
jgi:hypothetical protein